MRHSTTSLGLVRGLHNIFQPCGSFMDCGPTLSDIRCVNSHQVHVASDKDCPFYAHCFDPQVDQSTVSAYPWVRKASVYSLGKNSLIHGF